MASVCYHYVLQVSFLLRKDHGLDPTTTLLVLQQMEGPQQLSRTQPLSTFSSQPLQQPSPLLGFHAGAMRTESGSMGAAGAGGTAGELEVSKAHAEGGSVSPPPRWSRHCCGLLGI